MAGVAARAGGGGYSAAPALTRRAHRDHREYRRAAHLRRRLRGQAAGRGSDAGHGRRPPEAGRAAEARARRARERRSQDRAGGAPEGGGAPREVQPGAPRVRGPLRGHIPRLRPGRSPTASRRRCRRPRSRCTPRRRPSRSRPPATPASTSRRRTASSRTTSASSRACASARWRPTALASIPAVVETPVGPKIAIAESDIEDYPGLWLRGTGGPALNATFPPYPLEEKALNDRNIKVTRAADYIAVTRGTRTFPWRVLGVAPADKDLASSTLVYLLESPSRVADTSWIHPGKVAWDWWNALNLKGVDFQPGVNNKTYEHYIDFASRNGIEYIILDEGWYPAGRSTEVGAGDRRPRAGRLRQEEERRHHPVGDLEDVRQPVPAGAGAVFEVGREGGQGRFHATRRPAGDAFYFRVYRGAGEAQDAGRLSRRHPAGAAHADLAQSDLDGGRAGARAHEVEQRLRPGAQPVAAVHAHVPGADGLHAGRDAQRHGQDVSRRVQRADEPGHALPAAGDVRGVREPAADAGRLPHALRARARGDGVPGPGAVGVGREQASSTARSDGSSSSRAGTGRTGTWRR